MNLNFSYSHNAQYFLWQDVSGDQKVASRKYKEQGQGGMYLRMPFCLIFKSTGEAEDFSLHFMYILGGAGMGQHRPPCSASPTELKLAHAELEGLLLSHYIAFQLASFAFRVVHHSCHI